MKCTLSGAICQGGQAIARQSGKLSFVCLDMNGGSVLLRLTAPSTEKWAVGEVLNASLKAWPTVCQVQVEVKGQVGQSLPASQEGTGNFDVRWHPPLFICCTPASVALFSPNRASLGTPHPHLHQVVCYDFMIIYGALSGCACTFTTPSWSPLITGPRCRQSRRDGGAC